MIHEKCYGQYHGECLPPLLPYIFTKVARVLLKHRRNDGIQYQLYIDDGSGGHSTWKGDRIEAERLKTDLLKAVFIPIKKSSLGILSCGGNAWHESGHEGKDY